MNTKKSSILLAVILFTAVPASVAYSALNNDPYALVADQAWYISTSGPTLYGYVDYAVYAPGDYVGSLSFPDKFVYCYQIFNLSTSNPVSSFVVNLEPGATIYNPTFDSASASGDPGGINPILILSLPDSINYFSNRNTIPANQHSSVVLFTSYSVPTFVTGSITGITTSSIALELPTPIPEPATLLMFTLAVPLLVKTRKHCLTK